MSRSINLLLLILLAKSLSAQDVAKAKIQWLCNEAHNLATQDTIKITCEFISTGTKTIEWTQRSGAVVQRLQVVEVDGSWMDIEQPGKVVYTVVMDGYKGIVIMERTQGNEVFLTINFSDHENGVQMRFLVEKIKLLES